MELIQESRNEISQYLTESIISYTPSKYGHHLHLLIESPPQPKLSIPQVW